MSDNAEIVFAGNAKGLLDEYKKLEKANEQIAQKLAALMKVSKQAANEEKKLRQEVTQAIEKSKTPAEAYIATINRYKQALQAGMITAEQFNRIRDKELQKLNATKTAMNDLTVATKQNSASSKEVANSSMEMLGSFARAATIIGTATAALRAFSEEQKRIQEENLETVLSIDDMSRSYAIQAGIKEEQIPEVRNQILAVAKANSIVPEKAFAAAQQMSSVGFDDPANSGALDSFLKVLSTSNLRGGDPKQLASSMAQFLGAYNQPINEKTMLGLGVRMRGLMKEQVEVNELANFAQAAPGFAAAGVPMEEALGLMAGLRNKMPAAEAATGIRNVLSILQSASADKSNTKALKQIGLVPGDVDVVGETATEALQRFKTALDKAPKEDRAGILTQMFGRENQAKAQVVMEGLGDMPRFIEMQKDLEGFVSGFNVSQAGPAAEKIRTDIQLQQAQLIAEDKTILRQRIKKAKDIAYQEDWSAIDQSKSLDIGQKIGGYTSLMLTRGIERTLSLIPQEDAGISGRVQSIINAPGPNQFTEQDLRGRMNGANAVAPQGDPQAPALAEQTRVLKEISSKLTPPAKPTENPNLQGRPRP